MARRFLSICLLALLVLAFNELPTREASAATIEPADSGASQSARQLLAYLASLPARPDHRVISGQAIGRPGGFGSNNLLNGYHLYVEQLHSQTGKWVGLIGASYGQKSPREQPPYREADQLLADYWAAGGLVTIAWLPANPWTGGNQTDTQGGALSELLTPGTAAAAAWRGELDAMALDLERLQSAGVVVLFRPLPEHNGRWFWWGARRIDANDQFSALWRSTFDYFTHAKGLHNLLWVFAGSGRAPGDPLASYPGNDFVDIVGIDDYAAGEPDVASYPALVKLGKPVALAEFGPNRETAETNPHNFDFTFLREALKHHYDKFAYFMVWSGADKRPQALVENRNAAILLNDPLVANRDDISWRR